MKTLLLGLGNELLSDDAVGIVAVHRLRPILNGSVDVYESSLSGVALLELFVGYERAIIVDAVRTGNCPPGTIHKLLPSDLDRVVAPSPHYAGLPELLMLARQLELDFPSEMMIFAVEVADASTIGGGLSPSVAEAVETLIARIRAQLRRWQEDAIHA